MKFTENIFDFLKEIIYEKIFVSCAFVWAIYDR